MKSQLLFDDLDYLNPVFIASCLMQVAEPPFFLQYKCN